MIEENRNVAEYYKYGLRAVKQNMFLEFNFFLQG